MNTKVLGTIPETEEATGLSRSSIYKLLDAGKLDSVKAGKRRLLVWSSVQKLADTLRMEA